MSIFGNIGSTGTNMTGTPGGGLFGNQNTNQPSTASSLLGSISTTNANPLQPQPTQPVLFNNPGTTSATNPATGLFGSTNPNTTGASGTGGLFSSTTATPSTTSGSNLFGNPQSSGATGSSLFGNA